MSAITGCKTIEDYFNKFNLIAHNIKNNEILVRLTLLENYYQQFGARTFEYLKYIKFVRDLNIMLLQNEEDEGLCYDLFNLIHDFYKEIKDL